MDAVAAAPVASAEPASAIPVRHHYPLAIEDASLGTAISLLLKTLPFALARFAILVGCSIAAVIWWLVAVGGAGWLGQKVGGPAGLIWLGGCVVVAGGVWRLALRYALYLLKCGHIAVLTELITTGKVGHGGEGMFAYGKRVVTERFGEVSVLFAVDALVKGVVNALNRTLAWVAHLIPLPGLDKLAQLVNAVLRAATSYLDETIFSYGLARGDANPWRSAADGLVYYGQNAKPILKTAAWVVLLDWAATGLVWFVGLAPGFLLASVAPGNTSGLALLVGFLLAANVRSAFLKPLFLIMVMTRFHVSVKGQAIDVVWEARLGQVSGKFGELAGKARAWMGQAGPTRAANTP